MNVCCISWKQMWRKFYNYSDRFYKHTSNALYKCQKPKSNKSGEKVIISAMKKQISPGQISPANQIVESGAVEPYVNSSKDGRHTAVWKQLSAVRLIHHYNSTTTGSAFISQPSVAPKDLFKLCENNWSFKNVIFSIY